MAEKTKGRPARQVESAKQQHASTTFQTLAATTQQTVDTSSQQQLGGSFGASACDVCKQDIRVVARQYTCYVPQLTMDQACAYFAESKALAADLKLEVGNQELHVKTACDGSGIVTLPEDQAQDVRNGRRSIRIVKQDLDLAWYDDAAREIHYLRLTEPAVLRVSLRGDNGCVISNAEVRATDAHQNEYCLAGANHNEDYVLEIKCSGPCEIVVPDTVRVRCDRYRPYATHIQTVLAPGKCNDMQVLFKKQKPSLNLRAVIVDSTGVVRPLDQDIELEIRAPGGKEGTPRRRQLRAFEELELEADAALVQLSVLHDLPGYELKGGQPISIAPGLDTDVELQFVERTRRAVFLAVNKHGNPVPYAAAKITYISASGKTACVDARADDAGQLAAELPLDVTALKIAQQVFRRGGRRFTPLTKALEIDPAELLKSGRPPALLWGEENEDTEHRVRGTVFRAEGDEVYPGALVAAYDSNMQRVGQDVAGTDGSYEIDLLNAGTYYVRVETNERGLPLTFTPVDVNSTAELDLRASTAVPRTPRSNGDVAAAVRQISTFPAQSPAAARYDVDGRSGAGRDASRSTLVGNALRDVLSWQGKASDTKGFLAALKTVFTPREVDGHTDYEWTPRSYAVQTDLGASITGAQASLYTRAKVALDNALPLLDGLTALENAPDEEDVAAVRAIVRGEFQELVNEFGHEGGPRVDRVDALFEALFGQIYSYVFPTGQPLGEAATLAGHLGRLRDEFGFNGPQVNTVAEEQNLTNFLTVVDYLGTLRDNWQNHRDVFSRRFLTNGGGSVYLGTQLVHIERALSVVAESVREAYAALDSVFLGSSERQTTELTFTTGTPLFLAELLDWVERFAISDGPRLVQDGGKLGVQAFYPTIERLVMLVGEARTSDHGGQQTDVPDSYASARVQRAMTELHDQLENLERFARPYRA